MEPGRPVQPKSSPTTATHVLISGRVQGVGFRVSLQAQAQTLGVSGWCRNLLDGRVEALCWGAPPQAIEALLSWCETGPRAAEVAQIISHPMTCPESASGADMPPVFEVHPCP